MDLLELHDGTRHPWEQSRAAFFVDLASRALGVHGDSAENAGRVLDVGAGDAYLAEELRRRRPGTTITCWDTSYDDAIVARLTARTREISFTREKPPGRFDLVLMLDVVEHVEDDVAFVRGVVEGCLAEGGAVIVSVPAWQTLFSAHDELLLHHRRYAPGACDRVLHAAGLAVIAHGGLFHSLLAPRFASVVVEKAKRALGRSTTITDSTAARWRHGAFVTGAVLGALRIDNAVSRTAARLGIGIPGLSYWALTRRG